MFCLHSRNDTQTIKKFFFKANFFSQRADPTHNGKVGPVCYDLHTAQKSGVYLPDFFQSFRKPSMPLSVRGWASIWSKTLVGMVATWAPARAESVT